MTEHQKLKTNPRDELKREKARQEAEKLMEKRDLEEAGEDYERSQFWGYSAESVERWNEKQEAKKNRMDNKFTGNRFDLPNELRSWKMKTNLEVIDQHNHDSISRLGPSQPQEVLEAGGRAQAKPGCIQCQEGSSYVHKRGWRACGGCRLWILP